MAEIATAAGVGRATLYRYYPTREALLAGLAEAAFAELCGRIADAGLDTVSVTEGLARLTRGFMAAGDKYAALAGVKKEIRDTESLDQEIARPVRELLRRGIADGTLRADVPVEVLFELYSGLVERSLLLVMRRELSGEQAAAAACSLFLHGAVAPVSDAEGR
jgi:AcrR family transcriptional regulator